MSVMAAIGLILVGMGLWSFMAALARVCFNHFDWFRVHDGDRDAGAFFWPLFVVPLIIRFMVSFYQYLHESVFVKKVKLPVARVVK